jgi:hypothetical protein
LEDKEPMNKLTVAEKVIAQLKEEKPGLWANIRAKKNEAKNHLTVIPMHLNQLKKQVKKSIH